MFLPLYILYQNDFFHDGGPYHIENQYTDLLCKSMDWFLLNKDLRHDKVTES